MYFEHSPIFLNIKDIISSNFSPVLKQEKIEQLLNDTWYSLYLNKLESMSDHSNDFNKLLHINMIGFRDSFSNYVSNIKKDDKYLTPILSLAVDEISSCVFRVLFPIIFKGDEVNKTKTVIEIGKCVFNKWARTEYEKFKDNPDILP